jgi:hypothetical protein
MKNSITKNDVRELVESKKKLPLMVRWSDTGEIETVSAFGFQDNSGWSEKKRPHNSIANQDNVFDILAIPLNELNELDLETIAKHLNASE